MDEAGSKQRFGVYSDFWRHYLNWSARHCPWSVEPILLTLYSLLFFLAARPMREGIRANLRALFPKASEPLLWWKTYQVLWNFSAVTVDGARAREEPGIVEWEIEGLEHFDELRACPTGVIIVTAHMGNYDMAGSVFASRFERMVHAVRAPERNAELQKVRQAELTANNDEHYQVIYNAPGNMLGITLAQALQRGEAVAIQADRVLFDVAPMTVAWDDEHVIDIPQGPFVLSMTTGSPIYPLFMIRLGRCRYRVQIGSAFYCKRTGRDKKADLERAGQEWVAILRGTVTRFWDQWLVVEPNIKVKAP